MVPSGVETTRSPASDSPVDGDGEVSVLSRRR